MANFRYPLRGPVVGSTDKQHPTEAIDYVVFQRCRIKYKGNQSGYYGLNLPGNSIQVENNPNRVYLPIPPGLSTSYNPAYSQMDLGIMGAALAAGMGGAINDAAAGKDGSYSEMAEKVQALAAGVLPEFTAAAFAGVANSASQALGLAGGVNAQALAQLSSGKIFNPYTEQLFNNMQFRSHAFNFKMFARNNKEAEEIDKIIRYFKTGATPIIQGNNDDKKRARYMEVPDKFDIKFLRLDPRTNAFTENKQLHFKIFRSVCTNVAVNYTPDGQYNALEQDPASLTRGEKNSKEGKAIHVPAINLSVSFAETRFVGQADIKDGY